MREYEPYFTEDGSIGLYSYADKDVYHSKFGALTEAWEKFVIPSEYTLMNRNNIKVLDVCYGIGYNTKALMSFIINENKSKLENKNFLKKIFEKFHKKNITVNKNIVPIDDNKTAEQEISLFASNETKDDNNIVHIDCLDINEELVKLSPFFKTVKTPYEIFSQIVPDIFTCFDSYYKIRELFANVFSYFAPKNKKEIKELLDLKFKNMHITPAAVVSVISI